MGTCQHKTAENRIWKHAVWAAVRVAANCDAVAAKAADAGTGGATDLQLPGKRKASTPKRKGNNMKLCIPVEEYRGLDSLVYGHFGSAPVFALVDSETLAVESIGNRDHDHQHGACNPLKTLGGHQINAVIVGGIGPGAIRGLNQAGIEVRQFAGGSVAEAVRRFNANELPALTLAQACGGHSVENPCDHHSR
jgi:predicted Fe-Mo cluster-binding NifX family protein